MHTKVHDQLVSISLRSERKLLSRLLVVAKAGHILSWRDAIGEYEFNVAPPSNLHFDGSMGMLSGKIQVVISILKLPLPENAPTLCEDNDDLSALIIDAMCLVNI